MIQSENATPTMVRSILLIGGHNCRYRVVQLWTPTSPYIKKSVEGILMYELAGVYINKYFNYADPDPNNWTTRSLLVVLELYLVSSLYWMSDYTFGFGIILGFVLDGVIHSLIRSLLLAKNIRQHGLTIVILMMIYSMIKCVRVCMH
jgi:hypothetical protein